MSRPVLVAAAVLAALCTSAVPASANPGDRVCRGEGPARISITRDVTAVPATVTDPCYPDGKAYWVSSNAPWAVLGYEAGSTRFGTPTLYVPDQLYRYGIQSWRADGAVGDVGCTSDCEPVAQDVLADIDIRLGVAPWLTATRRGERVTLSVTSNTWSTSLNRFVGRSTGGELQIRDPDGVWTRLGNPFSTGSDGRRAFTYTVIGPRSFRYAAYSTTVSWDKVSTPVTR